VRALAPVSAPATPPPPCAGHDRSGGHRARVTLHALRRYGERILGLVEVLEGLDDLEAVEAMTGLGIEVPAIQTWCAFYGGRGVRHGAIGVCRDGIGLVLKGGAVVTVVSRRAERRR